MEIYGLVNCAGIGRPGLVADQDGEPLPFESFRRLVEVDLVGNSTHSGRSRTCI